MKCPVHKQPDCSPLLNGCSLVIRAHEAWLAWLSTPPSEKDQTFYSTEEVFKEGWSRRDGINVTAEERAQALADRDALDNIRAALDGTEWDSDTLEFIAGEVEDTGREIREPT